MDILTCLEKLFASYPQTPVQLETVAVYVEHLSKIPADELPEVIDRCIADNEKLPSIAAILKEHRSQAGSWLPATRSKMLTMEELEEMPNPVQGKKLYRETETERHERLRRTRKWDVRYQSMEELEDGM